MNKLKNLRNTFERFCYQNRHKGIPNLMLYVSIASAIVYVLSMMDKSYTLYSILCFDRTAILQGQIWRLITFPLTYGAGNGLLIMAISLLCYGYGSCNGHIQSKNLAYANGWLCYSFKYAFY